MLSVKIKSRVACIYLDDPESKVNVLSENFFTKLNQILESLKSVEAVVFISRKPQVFLAGADLKEIQKLKDKKDFEEKIQKAHQVFKKIKESPLSFISAVNGVCLGGGAELALACDYIIASNDSSTKIGFPEVNLGLIPGFGGTVLLPRRIGFLKALDMILTGKPLSAKACHKLQLVDQVEGSGLLLEGSALKLASEIISGKKPRKRKYNPEVFPKIFRYILSFFIRRKLLKKTRGFYPAPLEALKLVCKTYSFPLQKALEEEKKVFCNLAVSEISRHLIQLFFMTEKIKKQKGSSKKPLPPFQRIAVLGAGVMGSAISYTAADSDFDVRIFDIQKESLLKARNAVNALWQKQIRRKKVTVYDKKVRASRISYSLDRPKGGYRDLIIEALPENLNLKKQIIQEVSQNISEDTVFATNTSSLSVDDMAQAFKFPNNFIGLHFFNPVYRMPLVEVIQGQKTSDETLCRGLSFVKKLGKYPIIVKDSPGFVVNRLLMPWLSESLFFLEAGFGVSKIDNMFLKFGWPMGPFRLMDEVGLDICMQVIKNFLKADLKIPVPAFVDSFLSEKCLGKKTLKGFYHYTDRGEARSVNNEWVISFAPSVGSLRKTDENLLKKGLYRMINEGAKVLEEGGVSSADEIDFAMVMGAGFPAFYGGPFQYAQKIGIQNIIEDLRRFSEKENPRFAPSPFLKTLV